MYFPNDLLASANYGCAATNEPVVDSGARVLFAGGVERTSMRKIKSLGKCEPWQRLCLRSVNASLAGLQRAQSDLSAIALRCEHWLVF